MRLFFNLTTHILGKQQSPSIQPSIFTNTPPVFQVPTLYHGEAMFSRKQLVNTFVKTTMLVFVASAAAAQTLFIRYVFNSSNRKTAREIRDGITNIMVPPLALFPLPSPHPSNLLTPLLPTPRSGAK